MFTNYTPSLARVVGFGGGALGVKASPGKSFGSRGGEGGEGKGECIAKLLCVPSILRS